jgi:hypothetical protein
MRNFAYKNPDYIKNEVVPELVEEHPCYQQSVYDTVMYDESPDGDLIQCDMTQILLNQEKYVFRSAPLRGFLQYHRTSLCSCVRGGRLIGR